MKKTVIGTRFDSPMGANKTLLSIPRFVIILEFDLSDCNPETPDLNYFSACDTSCNQELMLRVRIDEVSSKAEVAH
jgi:hypothetical protein